MSENDELPIYAWRTTSEASAHLSFSKPVTQGCYSEPQALVLLSDAQRIRDERDRLREFAAFVIRSCKSGAIKSKPIITDDPNAAQLEMRSLEQVARAALAGAQE